MKRKIIILFTIILFILLLQNNLYNYFVIIRNSFNRAILEEARYILILKGLKSTIIISLLSILLGTLLGILLFIINHNKIFSKLSQLFIKFIQGTPITVLLLLFYFGIFGNINIEPTLVAILAFSVYFSAYCCEIIRGAYSSLNKTQIYSAYALGFNKIQTLKYIILPQILSYIIPVYKNETISLIKSTSIAGYISIIELTKASDIIRNRTYEAFFPLIFTAFIYFIICYVFGKTLDYIHIKINPRMADKDEE